MTFCLIIAKFQVLDLPDIQTGKKDCTFSTEWVTEKTDKNLISIWIITHYFYPNYK